MPRAGGVYTLPAGNPVVTLTVISTAWANTTMSDIATALTGSVPTDGTAPMTGPLRLADGAQNAPGLTWATETTSGWYRIANHQFGFSLNSVTTLQVNASLGWTIGTPAAGTVALNLNAVAGTAGLALNGGTGSFASLGFKDGQAGGTIWSVSVGVGAIGEFDIICNTTGNTALKIIPAGNVSIALPVTGAILALNSPTYGWNTAANNQSPLDIGLAGAVRADNATTIALDSNQYFDGANWRYKTAAAAGEYFIAAGVHTWNTGAAGAAGAIFAPVTRMSISNAGNVVIATPTSGTALTVTGLAGAGFTNPALQIQSSTTASQGNGLFLNAGTNANDLAFNINNAAGTTGLFSIFGNGSITTANATGGTQGLGTLNAAGLFVNGRSVVPVTVSQPGTTSRTTAVLSNDAVFTLPIPSAGTWQFRLDSYINNGGVASAGIVYNINYSAAITAGAFSGSGEFSGSAISASGAIISSTVAGSTTNVTTGVLTSGVTSAGTIQGTIVAGAAGTLSLSWASTSTNGMNIGNGSFTATRIA